MNKPTDDAAPEDFEATLDDAGARAKIDADRRAQQHDFLKKSNVWPKA